MKKKYIVSFAATLAISVVVGIFMSFPSLAQTNSTQKDERLGLKITTNFNDCKLYIPANLVDGKGLQVTIPIKTEEKGTAIRIIPLMENEKVSFSVSYISQKQTPEGIAKSERKIASRIASEGETLVVRDEKTTSDWKITATAFAVSENPNLIPVDGGDCECVLCGNLQICPAKGKCFTSSCGKVCCIVPN